VLTVRLTALREKPAGQSAARTAPAAAEKASEAMVAPLSSSTAGQAPRWSRPIISLDRSGSPRPPAPAAGPVASAVSLARRAPRARAPPALARRPAAQAYAGPARAMVLGALFFNRSELQMQLSVSNHMYPSPPSRLQSADSQNDCCSRFASRRLSSFSLISSLDC
jgi:hypothetical protein